jgi:hypothetical protein
MRLLFIAFLIALNLASYGQQSEQIEIPKGIVYKYADSLINEKAKTLIRAELSDSAIYTLNKGILFIGPVIWSRYKKVEALAKIKQGNLQIKGYKNEMSEGKLIQRQEDFKLVWDHLRSEVTGKTYKLRKATPAELKYYWSVISFDIEEPLLIIETPEHNYILNLSAKDFTLAWLDEAPKQ